MANKTQQLVLVDSSISKQISDLQKTFDKFLKIQASNIKPEADQAFDLLPIDKALELLGYKRATLYGFVHRKEIPYIKHGKRLMFSRKDLSQWVIERSTKFQTT